MIYYPNFCGNLLNVFFECLKFNPLNLMKKKTTCRRQNINLLRKRKKSRGTAIPSHVVIFATNEQ